jgi:cell division protein FtsB
MSPEPDANPALRKPARGPEPLRRKRVQPAPSAPSPRGRKLLNGILGFAAAVLLIDAFVGEKGLVEGLRAKRAYTEAQASLNALRADNAALRRDVQRFTDDPAAIESLAREQLGLIRPGELLFIVREIAPHR